MIGIAVQDFVCHLLCQHHPDFRELVLFGSFLLNDQRVVGRIIFFSRISIFSGSQKALISMYASSERPELFLYAM